MCALHWATLRGHLDAVKLLLKSGAKINGVASRLIGEDGERPADSDSEDAEYEQFTPLGKPQKMSFSFLLYERTTRSCLAGQIK